VATEQGPPIKLPLFTALEAEQKIASFQNNLLHAITPMTLLPDSREYVQDQERIAPLRSGYLYIMYQGHFWREIAVNVGDNDTYYQDVNLYHYRGDGTGAKRNQPLRNEVRDVTGKPLKDIWLPAKEKGREIGSQLRLMFSEIQLSATRINHYEKHPEEAQQRFSYTPLTRYIAHYEIERPELRPRNPGLELLLDRPSQQCHRLDTSYSSDAYQHLNGEQRETRALDKAYSNDFSEFNQEYAIKNASLQAILQQQDSNSDWDTGPGTDSTADARTRKLFIGYAADPLFDLRHAIFQVNSGVDYLQSLQADISQQKHYHSAELVQHVILPKNLGGKKNPFNQHADDLDTSLNGVLHRTLRTYERDSTRRFIRTAQQRLARCLAKKRTRVVLQDLACQEGIDGAACLGVVNNALNALIADPNTLDTYVPEHKREPLVALDTLIAINSGSHSLSPLLFPDGSPADIANDNNGAAPANDGSGLATIDNMQAWVKALNALAASLDGIASIDNIDLAGLQLEYNTEPEIVKDFTTLRRSAGMLDNLLSGFINTLLLLNSEKFSANVTQVVMDKSYHNVLRLLKATNDDIYGHITIRNMSGETIKNARIVGAMLDGMKFGYTKSGQTIDLSRQKGGPFKGATVLDNDNKLLLTTSKSVKNRHNNADYGQAKQQGVADPKQVSQTQYNKTAALFIVEDGKPTLHSKLEAEEGDIKRALKNYGKPGVNLSNAYEKLRLPYIITVIEIINLSNVINAFNLNDPLYSGINTLSAITDMGVALVHIIDNLQNKSVRLQAISTSAGKTLIPIGPKSITVLGAEFKLKSSISRLAFTGAFAGFVTVGLLVWDSIRDWRAQDRDAAIAALISATGISVAILAGTVVRSGTAVGTAGPIVWVAMGIAIAAGIAYIYLNDTQLQTWFKNGPFGPSPATSGSYQALQDPHTARVQLVNLLLQSKADVYTLEQLRAQQHLPPKALADMPAGTTHAVWLRHNMGQLLDSSNVEILAHPTVLKMATDNNPGMLNRSVLVKKGIKGKGKATPEPPLASFEANGHQLYFYRYRKAVRRNPWSFGASHYQQLPWYQVRARLYTKV